MHGESPPVSSCVVADEECKADGTRIITVHVNLDFCIRISATPAAAPQPQSHHDVVEIGAASIKKLAEAMGKSVKKAIKPGKGSANERYKLKDCFQAIWDKYKKDSKLKLCLNHKVYHEDVFYYEPAHAEIVALRSDPPITLEEFERSLGAFSDRKSRQSPAKRNKPR